jgi:hypothetical protein
VPLVSAVIWRGTDETIGRNAAFWRALALRTLTTDLRIRRSPVHAARRAQRRPPSLQVIPTRRQFGGHLAGDLRESDIQAGLREGGRLRSIFVVERSSPNGAKYVAYFRRTWKRGFHALQTYRGKSDRVYRDLDRLLRLVRDEFRYTGSIALFVAGDPDLQRFRALLQRVGDSNDRADAGQNAVTGRVPTPTDEP